MAKKTQQDSALVESEAPNVEPGGVVTPPVVGEAEFSELCRLYSANRRFIDAIRSQNASSNVDGLRDFLRKMETMAIEFHAVAYNIVRNGKGYTPPKEAGWPEVNAAEIASAILGARTSDSTLRNLVAKAGK